MISGYQQQWINVCSGFDCARVRGSQSNPRGFQGSGAIGCCLLQSVLKYTKALVCSGAKSASTAWISSFGTEHKKGQLTIIFYWLNGSRINVWVMTVVRSQCLQPPQPHLEEVGCLLFFTTACLPRLWETKSVCLPRLWETKRQVPF